MSIFRHGDASIEIRCFGVTFGSVQAVLPHQVVPPRAKGWHMLIYATRGVITVRTDQGAWVVPPHRAMWIPAGFLHRVEMSGVVALRALYIRALLRRKLFAPECSVVNVTPLLRELIVRTVRLGALDAKVPEQRRLIGVIFDELKVLIAVPLQLPSPQDRRAAQFAAMAGADPGMNVAVQKMLRQCGTSRRTMERLFRAETGMSLGQWMRRQKLLCALQRLASGELVNTVALELGYSSASAFIAMFRRELGQTPKSYWVTNVHE